MPPIPPILRPALALLALLCAASAVPASGQEEEPNGVDLIDSCGTYLRMREGAETYQPSQLERTRLCSDLLWTTAEELKKQYLRPGEKLRPRQERVRCELDPTPVGPNQAVRVVYKYLDEHPERLHLPAAELARAALRRAFGCEPAVPE